MSISQVPLSRRRFIVGAGALVIGAYLPSTGALARSNARPPPARRRLTPTLSFRSVPTALSP